MVDALLLVWRSQISNNASMYRTLKTLKGNRDGGIIHYKKVIKKYYRPRKEKSRLFAGSSH